MANANSMCTVTGCDRPRYNQPHGYCRPHYHRFWRHGHPQSDIPIGKPRALPIPVQDFADGTRLCNDCGQRLPIGAFHRDTQSPGGYRKTCKACRVAVETARYHSDPEHHRARMSQYRSEHPERARAVDMARYERNKPERIARATEQSHIRRARILSREVERGISTRSLRKRDGDECCYCGVTMIFASFAPGNRVDEQATIEHRQPLSRGGSHTWANCALACWRCNITKGARDVEATSDAPDPR